MAINLRSLTGRLGKLWHSSKLFGALVMLAVAIPALCLSALTFCLLMVILMIALACEFAAVFRSSDGRQQGRSRLVWIINGPMLIGGMAGLIVIRQSAMGVLTLFILAAGTFLNDAGAQTVGKLCAKRLRRFAEQPMNPDLKDSQSLETDMLRLRRAAARKLAGQPFPHASPNKTWVGLIGGLAAGWIASAGFLWWFHAAWGYPLGHGIVLVIITPLLAVCGDVTESAAKRSLGVKDMSHVLGAHGGFSDRLDAISMSAIGAALLQWVF